MAGGYEYSEEPCITSSKFIYHATYDRELSESFRSLCTFTGRFAQKLRREWYAKAFDTGSGPLCPVDWNVIKPPIPESPYALGGLLSSGFIDDRFLDGKCIDLEYTQIIIVYANMVWNALPPASEVMSFADAATMQNYESIIVLVQVFVNNVNTLKKLPEIELFVTSYCFA